MEGIHTMFLKNKFNNFAKAVKLTKYAFSLVWKEKAGKIYVIIKVIDSVINGVIPLISIVIPGLIINELTGGKNLTYLSFYIGALILVPLIGSIFNLLVNKMMNKLSLKLNLIFTEVFYDRVLSMDYETLEDPNIQIMKDRAQNGMGGIIKVIDTLAQLILAVVSLIAISSIIITLSPLIILIIIVVIIINSAVSIDVNAKKHNISQELSKFDMFQGAYVYMLDHFSYAKEIRLFNIKNLLINLYSKSKKESNKLEIAYGESGDKLILFQSFTGLIQQLLIYVYLIYKVLSDNLAIGSMTIYLSSIGQFSNALSAVFNAYIGLVDQSQKTTELLDFFSIPLKQQSAGSLEPQFNEDSVLEFKNVSFKYPGNDRYVIKNMNIKIRADEKLSIVGANGSGKSTFVKLLLRLYFPTDGEILLNGININEYDYSKYQRLFAPVFQDFVSYTMSVGENIVLAHDYDESKLDKICSENGLSSFIKKLTKGYNTQVGKWLDPEGIDPSGGEEQRIAIARACYHGGDIFVLDEPTAAIDPVMEYEIYSQFNKMITGKCAILITHRLSAVQLTDKIAVFDNGTIIEYGTHDELYQKRGLYTDMFDKQAYFYRRSVESCKDIKRPNNVKEQSDD